MKSEDYKNMLLALSLLKDICEHTMCKDCNFKTCRDAMGMDCPQYWETDLNGGIND